MCNFCARRGTPSSGTRHKGRRWAWRLGTLCSGGTDYVEPAGGAPWGALLGGNGYVEHLPHGPHITTPEDYYLP